MTNRPGCDRRLFGHVMLDREGGGYRALLRCWCQAGKHVSARVHERPAQAEQEARALQEQDRGAD